MRPAFLYGIGSGFLLAGVQLALRASLRRASTWAVGSFVGVSVVVFEGCHYTREQQKERVRLIQETLERRAKEVAREQFKRDQLRRKRDIEAKEQEEKQKQEREKWFWQR